MKENDSLARPLAPMLMGQNGRDYGICVEYSRERGFRAFRSPQGAPHSAENVAWEAYLGAMSPQHLEVFQGRLAQFIPKVHKNAEITTFLHDVLLETWDVTLAFDQDKRHRDGLGAWEVYACSCCSDLDAWLRDQDYEFVWDDWEDCLYTAGLQWLVDSMLFTDTHNGNKYRDGHRRKTRECHKWRSLLPFKEPLQRVSSKRSS